MSTKLQKHRMHRRGAVLIYVAAAMVAFTGLASLAVDLGHVWLVRNQLQFAADAVARYAATGLSDGTAVSKAVQFAPSNKVDGVSFVIQNSDVITGTWSNGTFTAGGTPANALQINAVHTAARGNAVNVWWGGLLGKSSCDLTESTIVRGTLTPPAGFIGYAGVTFQNNTFIGSYNSQSNKNPNPATAGSKARIGSNGSVIGQNNDTLQGSAVIGPSGSVSGITATGSTINEGSSLAMPTMPTWAPVNPTAYTVNGNTILPGGTYWFTSLTVNGSLTFSGPTTIYVNGDVILDNTVAPASGLPGDLTIYQYGSHSFGDNINGMNVTANVIAPSSNFTAKNNLFFYGSGLFNTILTKNNADFYYDLNLGPANGTTILVTVK